jgi:signal transduction histidine kinase
MGRVASAEQIARVRSGELTRRVIEAGYQARHEVATSLHDGPVQELVGVDMQLTSALHALGRGDSARASELVIDSRALVERNIDALRNELIGLGPVAFDELTFMAAVEQCAPAWTRRYGIEVRLALEQLDMPNEICGALFGITQEAVANAARHAEADSVLVSLARNNGAVELRVTDDGRGFGDVSPLGPREPGHLGLATMRERAAIVGGELRIESGAGGTEIRVRLPRGAEAKD